MHCAKVAGGSRKGTPVPKAPATCSSNYGQGLEAACIFTLILFRVEASSPQLFVRSFGISQKEITIYDLSTGHPSNSK